MLVWSTSVRGLQPPIAVIRVQVAFTVLHLMIAMRVLDTNGDNVDSSDNPSIATTGAYILRITVTDAGTILYGSNTV